MTHNFKTGEDLSAADVVAIKYGGEELIALIKKIRCISQPLREMVRIYAIGKLEAMAEAEPSPEEIDVANMWVGVYLNEGASVAVTFAFETKDALLMEHPDGLASAYRVHEWEAIRRGERKLKIGEGL